MKVITLILASIIGFIGTIFFISIIPVILWYCIDDTFASLVGNPALGNLSFFFVWPLSILIITLFNRNSNNAN